MVGNEPDKPSRRRRVTALLSQRAFAKLEKIAARTGRSNAAVAERLLSAALDQANVEQNIDGNLKTTVKPDTSSNQHK